MTIDTMNPVPRPSSYPDSEADIVPQTDSILGNIQRALTLLEQQIEAAGKKLDELKAQREAFLYDLRKLGGGD